MLNGVVIHGRRSRATRTLWRLACGSYLQTKVEEHPHGFPRGSRDAGPDVGPHGGADVQGPRLAGGGIGNRGNVGTVRHICAPEGTTPKAWCQSLFQTPALSHLARSMIDYRMEPEGLDRPLDVILNVLPSDHHLD